MADKQSQGLFLGIILRDEYGGEIAKVGDWSEDVETSKKFVEFENGEKLIGMKFGKRKFGDPIVFDIQFIIGMVTN